MAMPGTESITVGRARTGRRVRMAEAPLNDRYQARVGSALTPARVSAILRGADVGIMWPYADLLDEIREKDGHLQSVAGKREGAVSGSPWEIQPSIRAKSKKRAQRAADFCAEYLKNLTTFSDVIDDLQGAIYHGRACEENIWDRDGRYEVIVRCEPVHARRLSFAVNDWRLRIFDSSDMRSLFSKGNGIAVEELNRLLPGKFVPHTPRVRGGYAQREGLGRICVWYSGVFKAFGWRDLLAYAEQFGRPIRSGKYATGRDGKTPMATDEDIEELEEMLANLSSALYGVFPDTCEFDLHAPASKGSAIHPDLIRLCDEEVSKAFAGGTMTTSAPDKGARSLGDNHADESDRITRRDAMRVGETIRRYMLRPMILLNGLGDEIDVPHIAIITDPADDQNRLAERFVSLAKGGLDIAQDHVRDRMAIPNPAPGESLMKTAAPVAIANPDAPTDPQPGEPTDATEPGTSAKKPNPSKARPSAGKSKRT